MNPRTESDARFFLIKYMVDPQRREPINVGVAVESTDGWIMRFLGEQPNSTLQPPKWARLKRDIYAGWINYYRRKSAETNGWRDVERLQSRRPGNFYISDEGYQKVWGNDHRGALDALFNALVERGPAAVERKTRISRLERQVNTILLHAGIADRVERDVHVDAKYGSRVTQVGFRYRYVNGAPHLMDELVGSDPAALARNARELQSRVDAARDANSARSFLTFFSSAAFRGVIPEEALYPAEMVSRVIDTENSEAAAMVRYLVHADG